MEEIGCLTVKCVVYWEGVEWSRCLSEIDYLRFTITEEQVCQNRRTGPFTDYGGINKADREAACCAARCKQMPSITGLALSQRSLMRQPFGLVATDACVHGVDAALFYLVWWS